MSWSDWCKNIQGLTFVAGGIYGHDGAVWAEFCDDSSTPIAAEDVKNIIQCIDSQNPSTKPVNVKGKKQMGIKASDGTYLAKNGTSSCVVAVKCNQSIMIGIGGKDSEPRQLLDPLNKLASSLKDTGY